MSNWTEGVCSCGAKIIWAELPDEKKPGQTKRIPLDFTRARAYRKNHPNLGESIEEMRGNDRQPIMVYISHFRSCPDANKHSRGGKG